MRIKLTPLDKLFSEFIRRRSKGYCERCGKYYDWQKLQCSHFFGRAKKSVRWDEENASALCFGCHLYFTAHPLEHTEWFQKRLGDRFELLVARSRSHKPDQEAIALYYKNKLREIEK